MKKFTYILLFLLILHINICSCFAADFNISPFELIINCNESFQQIDSLVAQDLSLTKPILIDSNGYTQIYESLLVIKKNSGNNEIWGKIIMAVNNGSVFIIEQIGLAGPLPAMLNSSVFTYTVILHCLTQKNINDSLSYAKDHHITGSQSNRNLDNCTIKNLWDIQNGTHFIFTAK